MEEQLPVEEMVSLHAESVSPVETISFARSSYV